MNPNTKIMVVFFLTTLASCNLFEKKPFIADKNDPIIKIKENNEDIKEKIKIFPYEGKYSLEKKFLSLTRITEIYEKLSILLAEKIGLEKNPIEIEIKYVDWIPKYGEDKYFIFPKIESSKNTWKIRYVSEYLQNGNISSAIIYKTSLAEILIRNFSENGYGILPTAIWQSIIYYVCDLGEYLQKTAILSILKKPNSSLDTTIVGLDSSIFSTLEAYLSLLYVKNKYNQDGKEVVKKFINAILFKNVEWQKQLDITTGEVFGIFVENCKIFSKNLLHNNYQVVFSKYNSILKSYLNNEYGTTIAKGQTFLLNYHDSFLSRDTYFWMALSYYNLKNYDFCIAQLEAMFAENNKFSNYFALAKYRYAMALYRQEKLSYAIEIFSNFQRDFPWEKKFTGSALFFQAESLFANNQNERGMDLFERFFEIYPKHARFAQAIEKMAYIYLQNERYQRSRELFNKLSKLEIETETRISTNKSLAKISLLENEPSKALQNELNKTTKDYRSYTIAQKKEALNKIALIGKIALPWLRKMYSEDVLSEYITCVAKMNAPSGIPLLFDILHKKKNYDDKILIAILKIGIPATEMDSILNNEFDSFSKDRKVKLQKHFQDIFWGAPTSVLEKSPNFIKYINGNAKEQHLAIEEINLHLGSKQIPILQKLALQGKDETVKVHALENLLLWKDEKTYPFVKKMLPKASSNMRYLVLKNFYSIKYYEIENLEQMFTDQDSKVRNEALKILPFSNISDKIRLLVYLLDDKDYKIRNKARKLLLQSQDPKTNLILAKGLAKETNNIQYYAYVTGILRTRTKFELLNSYTPRMNSQQRIELMEELISKLK